MVLKLGFSSGGLLSRTLPPDLADRESSRVSSLATVDEHWMREALACAMSASGRSNPNPAVGCVTVKDGNAIASGATSGMGAAMPMVIDSVSNSDLLRGATIYIRCCRCSPTLH